MLPRPDDNEEFIVFENEAVGGGLSIYLNI